jgi:acyl carrier protein
MEAWVRTQFAVSPVDPRFRRDTDLFDNGYVDSVGLAELIGFLEDEFGVEIPDELLVSDQFTTIEGISQVVCRLPAA